MVSDNNHVFVVAAFFVLMFTLLIDTYHFNRLVLCHRKSLPFGLCVLYSSCRSTSAAGV